MKRCVTAFSTADRTVAAGTFVEDDDPAIKGHEAFFVDAAAEPQAAVIPGTDKVGDNAQTGDDEGGLPVSTQSGPGAAEAARRQAEESDDESKGERPADRRVRTQDSDVEQATAEPGQKRNTRRS